MTQIPSPNKIKAVQNALAKMLASQNLAVLATHDEGQPYTSLVAFVASPDLKQLYFATSRTTRKYLSLTANPRVAMMIDNRSNRPSDIEEAMAATAVGDAETVGGNELETPKALYLDKHPHMAEFAAAPDTALVRLKVSCYYVVTRFQDVTPLPMGA
jgi:heme iron utilization protein